MNENKRLNLDILLSSEKESNNFIKALINSEKFNQIKDLLFMECLKENENKNYEIKIANRIFLRSNDINEIKEAFSKIKNIDDLVYLINNINILRAKEDYIPLEKKILTYHSFINKNKFNNFQILKKDGNFRDIYAPISPLKNILTSLNIILHCVYKPNKSCHGFRKNRSIVTNAKVHLNKNYLYNLDLENFFPNIHQARVWKRLQLPPFNLNLELANLLAGLLCCQTNELNFLPQGSPTSPIISNIICEKLDLKLRTLAKKFNAKYTRYADDLTFSSNSNVFKKNHTFLIELERIITDEKFKINLKKVRLQKRGYRQEVTGIIVNEKLNLRRKFIKEIRFDIYLIERYGFEKAEQLFRNRTNKNQSFKKIIEGRLEYLKMVKGKEDSTYCKLKRRFILCLEQINKEKLNSIEKKEIKHEPKKLIKILSEFSRNDILKYTTHSWDFTDTDNKKDYDTFINNVRIEWKRLNSELQEILPKLAAKIYSFILDEELDVDKKSWGMNKICVGWSSPCIMKWSREGNNPFQYFLENKFRKRIDDKNIDRFVDVIELFKHEIEVRSESKQLKKLFRDLEQKYLSDEFNLDLNNVENVSFYTDVQWLKKGLSYVFQEISRRKSNKNIIIKTYSNIKDQYIEIIIIHEGSSPNKNVSEMRDEVLDGDFEDIQKYFISLCDWAIEGNFLDGSYRIDYLSSIYTEIKIQKLDVKPEGFTHILRFYK